MVENGCNLIADHNKNELRRTLRHRCVQPRKIPKIHKFPDVMNKLPMKFVVLFGLSDGHVLITAQLSNIRTADYIGGVAHFSYTFPIFQKSRCKAKYYSNLLSSLLLFIIIIQLKKYYFFSNLGGEWCSFCSFVSDCCHGISSGASVAQLTEISSGRTVARTQPIFCLLNYNQSNTE